MEGWLSEGFVTTSADKLINWARTGSMWPMTLGGTAFIGMMAEYFRTSRRRRAWRIWRRGCPFPGGTMIGMVRRISTSATCSHRREVALRGRPSSNPTRKNRCDGYIVAWPRGTRCFETAAPLKRLNSLTSARAPQSRWDAGRGVRCSRMSTTTAGKTCWSPMGT